MLLQGGWFVHAFSFASSAVDHWCTQGSYSQCDAWPLRWLVLALALGLSAATALWAFEFGKSIAGLEPTSRQELMQLRAEIERLREQSQQTQLLSQTAESLLTADRATLERLTAQVKQLEAENRALRDDLGFFEKLIPTAKPDGVTIRGLKAELVGGAQLKWPSRPKDRRSSFASTVAWGAYSLCL